MADALAHPSGRAAQLLAHGTLEGHTLTLPQGEPPAARGLGDIVASIAQPIAKGIDALAGTHLGDCGGCKKRREALNRMVPEI